MESTRPTPPRPDNLTTHYWWGRPIPPQPKPQAGKTFRGLPIPPRPETEAYLSQQNELPNMSAIFEEKADDLPLAATILSRLGLLFMWFGAWNLFMIVGLALTAHTAPLWTTAGPRIFIQPFCCFWLGVALWVGIPFRVHQLTMKNKRWSN